MTGASPERTLVVLEQDEALALAATTSVGRLIHVRGGRIFAAPVNVLLEHLDVLFRTAAGTELMTAAREHASAAFEVDDVVDWSRSGWSVLIRGRLSEVTDPATIEQVLRGGLQPWAGGDRDHVLRLSGEEVTGRRLEPGPGGTTVIGSRAANAAGDRPRTPRTWSRRDH